MGAPGQPPAPISLGQEPFLPPRPLPRLAQSTRQKAMGKETLSLATPSPADVPQESLLRTTTFSVPISSLTGRPLVRARKSS